YTSIGSIHDTVPNALLSVNDTSSKEKFKPAYLLSDGRLERAGRVKKNASVKNDVGSDSHKHEVLLASVIAVGDEILSGTVEDQLGLSLCKKLTSVGWSVQQTSVLRNDIDSVSEEVDRQRSICDMVFIYGGVGPLHSDVTLAGVAKAFGVRLAPDEEFEEYLRHLISEQCTGDRNEMAQLPEGITELLHHEKLSVPLIKCRNVIVLAATNTEELEKEWECLTELTKLGGSTSSLMDASRRLITSLTDVEVAEPLSKLGLEFPDIYLGCYRKSRQGPIIISLKGKDNARIDSAVQALCKKLKEGRVKKNAALKNDVGSDSQNHEVLLASVIAVGDEILSGTVEDQLGLSLCKKLTSVGWSVQQTSVLRNDIDSVSEEVDRQRSICDMVFIYGGVGPLHSDVTLAGVAKAFGVRLAPDEEFEEYLRHLISEQCTGDRNEMAQLPEGITELLHHEKLSVPLIKCRNVIVLAATNTEELEKEWECLTELTKLGGSTSSLMDASRRLMTSLTDVEVAEPLSKLGLEFPDIYLGCYRKSRQGPIIISLKGKDNARIDSAVQSLCKKIKEGVFVDMK
ncbi:hypothetical protein DY000_02000123, partial [Brassica cretica]